MGQFSRPGHLVDAWYLEKAHAVFAERLGYCFMLFDYPEIPSLSLRKLEKRWGSYLSRGNRIILNRNLIQASKRQIDYVIIHELCHVTHQKHNRAFFDLLGSKLPKWQETKAELELRLLA